MFVYTVQRINKLKGRQLNICLQCLEHAGHKENPFDVEPINWKEHAEATCTVCKKIEYRFAFNR